MAVQSLEFKYREQQSQALKSQTTYAFLKQAVDQFGDQEALIFLPPGNLLGDPIVWTYRKLLAQVNQTANMLYKIGAKGKSISYILPNTPEASSLLLAAQTIGIANPINPAFTSEQIADLIATAGSETLVISAVPTPTCNLDEVRNCLKKRGHTLKNILIIGGKEQPEEGIYNYEKLLRQAPNDQLLFPPECNPHAPCIRIHTSGSTGEPKLVEHTHAALLEKVTRVQENFFHPGTAFPNGFPSFHVGGIAILMAALRGGTKTVMLSPRGWMDPDVVANFWKIAAKYEADFLMTFPNVFNFIAQTPVDKNLELKLTRALICRSSGISQEGVCKFTKETGIDKFGCLYGSTENIIGTVKSPGLLNDYDMGKALTDQTTTVMKFDSKGNCLGFCMPGEVGILCEKREGTRYVKEELNQQARTKAPDGSIWYKTDDWVKQNKDGSFSFVGREEDMIRHQGQLFSLTLLEQTAIQHPFIKEVTAFSVSAKNSLDQKSVLCVVLQPKINAESALKEISTWLKEKLPKGLIPNDDDIFSFVELPKIGSGKYLKYKLRDKYQLGQAKDAIGLFKIPKVSSFKPDESRLNSNLVAVSKL